MAQKDFFKECCCELHDNLFFGHQDSQIKRKFTQEKIKEWVNKGLSSLRKRKTIDSIDSKLNRQSLECNEFIKWIEKPKTSEMRHNKEVG